MGDGVGDGRTVVEQRSDHELVATRMFDAPVQLVFDAWSKPELFKLWWAPKSMPVPLLSCEMDVRVGKALADHGAKQLVVRFMVAVDAGFVREFQASPVVL